MYGKTVCLNNLRVIQLSQKVSLIMSDYSISIVPKISDYSDNKIKAKEILDWLISIDVVKPELSDCVLGTESGYALSNGAKNITIYPEDLPYDLITNGLEIILERQIFHTGEGGLEECICPNCNENVASENYLFFNQWNERNENIIFCPNCDIQLEIHEFKFQPEWGFSNLGFTFWNWPELNESFIIEFRKRLGTEINVVFTHI
jgi:hypothetical protein